MEEVTVAIYALNDEPKHVLALRVPVGAAEGLADVLNEMLVAAVGRAGGTTTAPTEVAPI